MHNRENRKGHLTVCPSEYRINCILRIRTVRHFAGQLWPPGCMSVSAAPEQMCLPKSMGNYTMYAGTRIPPAEPHRLACGFSQFFQKKRDPYNKRSLFLPHVAGPLNVVIRIKFLIELMIRMHHSQSLKSTIIQSPAD